VLLATVKGDVHDIGKNIVGVVLGCNNYEVIDLGVMVPVDRILDEAAARKADIIGLSGLITPSLDEMVVVAREMERRHVQTPLLIGGATTSRQHTAVKIAPEFSGPTVHVLDASRAVDVVSSLLSDRQRDTFIAGVRAEQEELRERYSGRRAKALLTIDAARANHLTTDWDTLKIPVPWFVGRRTATPSIEELVPFIDWTFFFSAWELKGRFPDIFDHPQYGGPARELYERRLRLLARQHRRRRHRRLQRRCAADRGGAVPHAAPARADCRRPAESLARRLRRAARIARARLHRRVRGDVRHRSRRCDVGIRAREGRLQRDHQQGAGRSVSIYTRRRATTGATRPTRRSRTTTSSARNTVASGRRSATRPVPITARRRRSFRCWTRRRRASS
jgi:methylmalonyl-CoA mutase cobalamin-binding subunit